MIRRSDSLGSRRFAEISRWIARIGTVLIIFAFNFAALIRAADSSAVADSARLEAGEKIARLVCSSCHLFPEPSLLDKKTWVEQVLPRMETRLGVSPPDYSKSPDGELIRSLRLYPDAPAMSKAEWGAIVEFYTNSAPSVPVPQATHPEIQIGLKLFEAIPARARMSPPLTTLVQIGSSGHTIFVGDDGAKSLAMLDSQGRRLDSVALDNVPVSLTQTSEGVYVTAVGSVAPTERQLGALFFVPMTGGHFGTPKQILKELPRAAQTEFCDFNRDGKMDFAICLFGNHRGRFSWFENLGHDQYAEHLLIEKSGAIHCVAHDFNGDGIPDIGLLMAQESESFSIFTNNGKGEFSREFIFQKQPAFGHDHFELADFNGDGRDDLLVANGDNGEYESPTKNYHGIRIYLNRGGNKYEEAYFFPLNGATKAIARDFDGDGDLDIAAISFFPDYVKTPRESFVYLENRGGLKFVPVTFPQCISGRWIAMDAGDVDGDGDIDIVLGSYIRGPTSVPGFLSQIWEKQGPSVMILKNRRR